VAVYTWPSMERDGQKNKKTDKLGLLAPRGVDPHSPNFQGM